MEKENVQAIMSIVRPTVGSYERLLVSISRSEYAANRRQRHENT